MNTKRLFIFILSLVLLITCLPSAWTASAEGEDDWPFELSKKSVSGVSQAFSTKSKIYNSDRAAQEGVPEGYSGKVISVGKNTSLGATFDFTEAKIKADTIESITFRYYIESTAQDDGEYPELRIFLPNTTTYWAMRHYAGEETDRWAEIALYNDGTNFHNDYRKTMTGDNAFSVFADSDGYLAYFELYVRRHSGSGSFYIDDVRINYIRDDGVPPVITVPGDSYTLPYGGKLNIGATAYDESDAAETPVEYKWKDESRLDENGNPTVGEHILVISSEDKFGNTAVREITVTVTEADTVPPVINLNVKDVYVPVGTKPQLRYSATDESGGATCVGVWSEGAINEYGRLTKGLHTYTVTATDMSGNTSDLVINFHVGETNPAYN